MSGRPATALLPELAAYARQHAVAPARVVTYGPGAEQVADLRLPAGPGPHPLAILLHGGFWRAAWDRSLMDALAVALARAGWASLNAEYRRVGNGGGGLITLADVRAALGLARSVDAPVRRDEVIVIGHSAGGQLALCVREEPGVAQVISLAGVCDLQEGFAEGIGDGAVAAFTGGPPDAAPEVYAAADPLARLPARGPATALLVHGDRDDRVPVAHSRVYAAAGGGELVELADVDHFALIDPRSDAWRAVAGRLITPATR